MSSMDETEWDGIDDASVVLAAAGLPIPPKPMYTYRQFVKSGVRGNGVYFIWVGGEIVYVGKTCNIQARLRNHHQPFDDDDSVSFLMMSQPGAESVAELLYIASLKPKRNKETIEAAKCQKKTSALVMP